MDAGKKIGLSILGFFLGIILFILFMTGLVLSVSGILLRAAAAPYTAGKEIPENLGSIEEETARLLDSTRLGPVIVIGETELRRIILAALGSSELPPEAGIAGLDIEMEPGRIRVSAGILLNEINTGFSGYRITPRTLSVAAAVRLESLDEAISLTIDSLSVGRFSLPLGLFSDFAAAYELPETDVPLERSGPYTLRLPYTFFQDLLPAVARLEHLEAVQDGLRLGLDVDTAAAAELEALAAPFILNQGEQFKRALQNVSVSGRDKELLDSAVQAADRLISRVGRNEAVVPEDPSAFVAYLENRVTVQPAGGNSFIAAIGDDLFSGAVVSTGADSIAELILRDKSVMKIGRNTVVTLEELPPREGASDSIFSLVSGTIRSRVNKMIGSGSSFEIRTPSAVMGVRGTDFMIALTAGKELSVTVLEGRVELESAAGANREIGPGKKLKVKVDLLDQEKDASLEPEEVSEGDRKRIESELGIRSEYEDEDELRVQTGFLITLDEVKQIAAAVMAMDAGTQERLAAELQQRIPVSEVQRQFDRMSAHPEFKALMDSFGIDSVEW
jgi:hypothetical protein